MALDHVELANLLVRIFTTKTNQKTTKESLPKSLPIEVENALLNEKNPVETILKVSLIVSTLRINRKGKILRSLSNLLAFSMMPYKYSNLYQKNSFKRDEFMESRKQFEVENVELYKKIINEPNCSPLLLVFITYFDWNYDEANPVMTLLSTEQSKTFLERLWVMEAYYEFCSLVAAYKLHVLMDFNRIIHTLLKKNAINELLVLYPKKEIEFVLNYIENHLLSLVKNIENYRCNSLKFLYSKSASKLITVNKLDMRHYPCILVTFTYIHHRHLIRELYMANSQSGNPLYDNDEICFAILNQAQYAITDLASVSSNNDFSLSDVLLKLLVSELELNSLYYFSQFLTLSNEIERTIKRNGEMIIHPTKNVKYTSDCVYYVASAPIHYVDTAQDLEMVKSHIEETIYLGLDCEWTKSPISITQICLLLNDNSRKTFIIDFINLDSCLLHDFFNYLFEARLILGFDAKQDISRIMKLLNLNTMPKHLHDIQSKNDRACKSLEDYVNKYLNKKLDKRPRMGFWDYRPLCETLILYAGNISS
jgi:hypothetical protein